MVISVCGYIIHGKLLCFQKNEEERHAPNVLIVENEAGRHIVRQWDMLCEVSILKRETGREEKVSGSENLVAESYQASRASRKDFQRQLKRFETTVPDFVFLYVILISFSFLIIWNQPVVVEIKLFAFGYVLAIVVLVFIVYKFFLSEEVQQKRSRADMENLDSAVRQTIRLHFWYVGIFGGF